jgi:hypothetical protein
VEKTALTVAAVPRCAFMRHTNVEKAIPAKWPIRIPLFAETVSGAFRNAHGEPWKNLWIRTS